MSLCAIEDKELDHENSPEKELRRELSPEKELSRDLSPEKELSRDLSPEKEELSPRQPVPQLTPPIPAVPTPQIPELMSSLPETQLRPSTPPLPPQLHQHSPEKELSNKEKEAEKRFQPPPPPLPPSQISSLDQSRLETAKRAATEPETELGVHELANRVETAVNNFLRVKSKQLSAGEQEGEINTPLSTPVEETEQSKTAMRTADTELELEDEPKGPAETTAKPEDKELEREDVYDRNRDDLDLEPELLPVVEKIVRPSSDQKEKLPPHPVTADPVLEIADTGKESETERAKTIEEPTEDKELEREDAITKDKIFPPDGQEKSLDHESDKTKNQKAVENIVKVQDIEIHLSSGFPIQDDDEDDIYENVDELEKAFQSGKKEVKESETSNVATQDEQSKLLPFSSGFPIQDEVYEVVEPKFDNRDNEDGPKILLDREKSPPREEEPHGESDGESAKEQLHQEDPNAFYEIDYENAKPWDGEENLPQLPIPQALRFYINIGVGVMHMDVSKHLSYVLGFDKTRIFYSDPASYVPDLSGGVRQLYVYAPKLVEDTIIGDRLAPLLRVVNATGMSGVDMPEVIYTNEFFHSLQNKRISEIRIEIQTAFVNWSQFLSSSQEGRGELQYFVGTKYQRGGGLIQKVARFLMPVASNLLTSASKEGIAAGTRVLGDLAQGKALKESLQTHAKQGFENLAEKLEQCGKALNQTGPYLFRLFSDSQYCDLSKTYLYLLTSIERKNDAGEWVPISDTIAADKHVNISGIEVFDSSIFYHYRAYIMQELSYSHEVRRAFHEAGCYYVDENNQDSYANKDVVFTIHRNSDSFLLLTPPWKTIVGNTDTWHQNTEEYRIRLHDMRLFHANVRSISAEANGMTYPSTPYHFSFEGDQKRFVRAFVDMYAGLGLDDSDIDCCVHIVNLDHHDQRVYIEGTLDLIGDFELYSTCYPRRLTEGVDWSQPLYVEMKDLMICQKDSPQCRFVQRNQHQVDEMDLFSKTNNIDDDDDDNDVDFSSW
ncbi:hypothetical protein GPALN_007721 [Globodera pallida]|nr:hypothetical protein GPALN_007721 [Globodera pallida]